MEYKSNSLELYLKKNKKMFLDFLMSLSQVYNA